ncbi:Mu-like prophage major head subunit gpT family protein [Mannheimia haemolytica]|uniref:Mu-like prophage major head subunit gpT family protein n=1 Tax=Mannheimia haemolytica TaxID=75985 RepID=UPI0011BB6EAE|nr:hypothetical protein BG610_08945 [Mannheimia haemolytica]
MAKPKKNDNEALNTNENTPLEDKVNEQPEDKTDEQPKPPELEFAARKLLEAELIDGTTNTLKGVLKVVVNPFIAE